MHKQILGAYTQQVVAIRNLGGRRRGERVRQSYHWDDCFEIDKVSPLAVDMNPHQVDGWAPDEASDESVGRIVVHL